MNAPSSGRPASGRPEPKPGITKIDAYVGGKSKVAGVEHPVKLSSNENILGCSPAATAAYIDAAHQLHKYPDGGVARLRAAVAERYGLEPERLVFGQGTDEVFALLQDVLLEPGDNIVQGQYGFTAYAIGARKNQAEVRYAAEPQLVTDVDGLLALVDARTRAVFIANPSNPTGTWITAEEVRRLHEGLPAEVVLVLDGAYAEFCTDPRFDDGLALARQARNVVVTHTFSKLHGLASLRVGWGYMPVNLADAIDRVRLPFNVSIAGYEAAIAALGDEDFQRRSIELVERWRPWLTQQIGGLGLEVTRSAANFILVHFPRDAGRTAADAEAFLGSRGYIVRGVGGYGLPDCLRITIGLEEHNRGVVEALAAFLSR
jgi:histidinol-phosphate aminotransferase